MKYIHLERKDIDIIVPTTCLAERRVNSVYYRQITKKRKVMEKDKLTLEYSEKQGFFHCELIINNKRGTGDWIMIYKGLTNEECYEFTEKMLNQYKNLNTGNEGPYPSVDVIRNHFNIWLENRNLKKEILRLLLDRQEIHLTRFMDLMPEIKGEYSMYMPVKEGINPNIVWEVNVSQKFIIAFNELMIKDKAIMWKPCNIWDLIADGAPILDLPIADLRHARLKKECWLPITIFLTKT